MEIYKVTYRKGIIMIYTIQNEKVLVQIKQKGAELTSMKNLADNTEYIWQGSDIYRPQAEFLFPIMGFTENDEVTYQGQTYKMPTHGFAKDTLFKVTHEAMDSISFQITDTEESLALYPFKFEFNIIYKLEESKLTITCQVINKDEKLMYFSLGQHVGFTCPIERKLEMSDYYFEFDKKENIKYNDYSYETAERLPTELVFLEDSNIWPLSFEKLTPGPIILHGLESDSVTIKSDKNQKSVKINFGEHPTLSIWSSEEPEEFVCVQPWHGTLPMRGSSSNDLAEKEGMRTLESGKTFESSQSFEIK